MTSEQTVLETMDTARSMRWFTDQPVERDLLTRLVWAGTRASSPNNTQHWDFVVVTDPTRKHEIQQAIQAAFAPAASDEAPSFELPKDPSERRTTLGALNVLATMDAIPALVFVCGANRYPETAPAIELAYSAVYAAAQNMVVAARAMGLGACFTTFHQAAEPQIRTALGLPDDRLIAVTMPVGWPARPFGPVNRRPVDEVLHWDRW